MTSERKYVCGPAKKPAAKLELIVKCGLAVVAVNRCRSPDCVLCGRGHQLGINRRHFDERIVLTGSEGWMSWNMDEPGARLWVFFGDQMKDGVHHQIAKIGG